MNLKSIGKAILKGASIVTGPVAGNILKAGAAITPTTTDDKVVDVLTSLRGVVQAVEVVGQSAGLTGAQKLDAAAALARQVILQSEAFAGHEIIDEAAFEAGLRQTVSGLVGMLNSVEIGQAKAA